MNPNKVSNETVSIQIQYKESTIIMEYGLIQLFLIRGKHEIKDKLKS